MVKQGDIIFIDLVPTKENGLAKENDRVSSLAMTTITRFSMPF